MNEPLFSSPNRTPAIPTTTFIVFVLSLLLVVISACSQAPSLFGLLQQRPTLPLHERCPLPCYRGITPGVTTHQEAYHILQEDKAVISARDGEEFLTWIEEDNIEGRLLIKEDTAAALSLHFPETAYTLETLLGEIGKPDYLHITLPHPRHSPDPGNPQCDVLRLVYESYDMEVVTYQRRSGAVHADHTVQRITVSPTRSQRAILTPYYRRDWQGFQSYCIPVKDIFQD